MNILATVQSYSNISNMIFKLTNMCRFYSQRSFLKSTNFMRDVPRYIDKPAYAVDCQQPIKPAEIEIKNSGQIQRLRKSCRIARKILNLTSQHIKAGVSTNKLDEIVHDLCIEESVYPSPLGYCGYPKSVCTSVNHVACHGIPDDNPLNHGDILNIDVTVYCDGYHGDVSETYAVGDVDEETQRLIDVSRQCRDEAIAICRPGARFCEIGNTISEIASSAGYSIVSEFCGHGIGSFFHGPPDILHYAYEDAAVMLAGMAFTIEPVICSGHPAITILNDGWTAVTLDRSLSAQFEHTVLVTQDGVEILTSSSSP